MEGKAPVFEDSADTSKDKGEGRKSNERRPRVPLIALGANRAPFAEQPKRIEPLLRMHGLIVGDVARPPLDAPRPLETANLDEESDDDDSTEAEANKDSHAKDKEAQEAGQEDHATAEADPILAPEGEADPLITGEEEPGDSVSEETSANQENLNEPTSPAEVLTDPGLVIEDEADSAELGDAAATASNVAATRATTASGRSGGAGPGRHVTPPVVPLPTFMPPSGSTGSGAPGLPPQGPGGPNTSPPFFGPNGMPPTPNFGIANPNGLSAFPATPNIMATQHEKHEHRHMHPGLAALMVAGLVVEHMLGKHADRKLEKRMTQQVDVLREQVKENQAIQERLSQTKDRHEQEIAALQTNRAEAEQLQTLLGKRIEEIGKTVGAREILMAAPVERAAESRPATLDGAGPQRSRTEAMGPQRPSPEMGRTDTIPQSQESNNTPVAEALDMPSAGTSEQLMSKLVMEQVAAAAENNAAVERVYERRSEVKDDPSFSGGGAQSGSGGGSSSYQLPQATARNMAETQATLNAYQRGATESESYHRAVVNGFAAGVLIIIVGLIAYLMMR